MAYTTIDDPTIYFQTTIYTGNGGTQTITHDGSNLQADMIWVKSRGNTNAHQISNTVSGLTKVLETNDQGAENTVTNGVTSVGANTFALGSNSYYNQNSINFVSWNWLAGGSASSNSDGSVTSSVSANTTAGFSIIGYTGTGSVGTIGHGLNSAPELVILRNRAVSSSWWTWGELLGNVNIMELQSTAAKNNPNGNYHNDTMPTSSVITFGSDGQTSGDGQSHICYAFHSVKGYSKIGSYTGNGNADGAFIYTGFSPAFVLLKNVDEVEQWWIFDNKRNAYDGNFRYYSLNPNANSAEGTTSGDNNHIDFYSNGFKLRTTAQQLNGTSDNFIYMAFAEAPFVTSTGVSATAR